MLRFRFFLFSIIAILLLLKCNDDPTELGLGILPEGDLLSLISVDSITMKSSNVYPFELFPTGDNVMIGIYKDPVLGTTKASLLTEFGPVRNRLYPVPPSGKIIADTLMIYLRWMNSFSGKANQIVNMQVYLLKDTLPTSAKYHRGNFNLSDFIGSVPVMSKAVDLSESDTIITLMLPQNYADALASLDSNDYNDDKSFREALSRINIRGFYITTSDAAGPGAVASYSFYDPSRNPTDSVSYNLLFTYHTEKNPVHKDFWFTFSSYVNDRQIEKKKNYFYPKINVIENDYSSTKFYNELNGGQGDTLLYIQGPLGVKVKLDMSFLDSLVNKDKNANIDVAKAELILPSDTTLFENSITSSSLLENPARLSLQVSATFGNNNVVESYSYFYKPYNDIFTNGSWNKKAYVFNISEYVQEYLNGRTNIKELFIGTSLTDYAVEGVNLRRGNKIKLNLKYSKFKTK